MTRRIAALISVLYLAPAAAEAQSVEGQLVVSGLTNPVQFVQHPTLANIQLIVEQGGLIRTLDNGSLTTNYADLTGIVSGSGGEQGLLGLAFAPDFATSRRLYVNFTNTAGNTVISRFLQPNDVTVALDITSRFDLVWPGGNAYILQPFTNHNGGDIAFGDDGYLYIPLGDGGDSNDPAHNAQTPSTLLGKILRIDVSVSGADPEGYDIPADNPFVGQGGYLAEIWAFGLRNPWRFSFDSASRGGTGAMVVADVGQVGYEEVNYEPAGQGGRNYGWRNREAAHDHITSVAPAFTPLTDPIHEYPRAEGHAITGGFVYRGSALGSGFQGRYFFGDFSFSRVWSVALTIDSGTGEATASDLREHTGSLGAAATNPSSFGVDTNGEIYVVNYSGSVYKLVPGNFIDNPSFDQGLQANGVPLHWLTWAIPDPALFTFSTAGNQMAFRRPVGATQAVVFQETGVPVATGEPIEVTFTMGNTDTVRKRVSVLAHDQDFSDVTFCTFWLDPLAPVQSYRMVTHTTSVWTGATLSFYAATESDGGNYVLDDVSLRLAPGESTLRTTCEDPLAPVAASTAGTDLITNGTFASGFSGWALFGSITAQVLGGVFEFYRPPGTPAGSLLQNTSGAQSDDQRFDLVFQLGNSSPTRQRVTILVHAADFSDLNACTFYLDPGLPLSTFSIRMYATKAWTGASVSFYSATIGSSPSHEWLRVDNVTLTPIAATTVGTECVEPGG